MLWKGRFSKNPKKKVIEFNSSENIQLDERLVAYDIIGSIAHVKMLSKQKILKENEADEILKALKEVYKDWQEGRFKLSTEHEDVHMNIEAAVSEKTQHGKKMHTARSRNDQILLDMRMYLRDEIIELAEAITKLQESASKLKDGPMVGYTHTRIAQPITVSFWAEAIVKSLQRDLERLVVCFSKADSSPLGACALAGSSWPIDREYTAKLLGFGSVQENELDTISSRGELEAELLSQLSILMAKLSGLAEELIWLSEKGLMELPDDLCTGSSIMPNKKNPDTLELVRGRTGRVYASLNHVLTVKKGLISGYHSDMQETKYAVMQGVDTAKSSIMMMSLVLENLAFNDEKIIGELDRGFAQATEIADHLAMQMPFREAHEKTGKLVKYCEDNKTTISKIGQKEAEKILGMEIPEWKELVSVKRKRLERKVEVPENKISKKSFYKKLLS